MKDIDPEQLVMGDKSGIDLSDSRPSLKALLKQQQDELAQLPADTDAIVRARLQLDIAETLLGLQQKPDSWDMARGTFDVFVATGHWQDAIEACDILFQCEQPESLVALGNGVWLSVTYPVPAQLTVAMLQHIVDETPNESDGGAVAAMAAHYIANLRTEGKEHESLTFFTNQLVAGVAKRHRNIENDPEMIKLWTEILGLNDVPELLARLGDMLNVIVGDKWWIDRDALRAQLPAQ